MAAIQKMFNLTDKETEYCLFLFIITAWSPAREFFDDYLDCRSFSGRQYLRVILNLSWRDLDDVLKGTLFRIGMIERDFSYEISLNDEFLDLFQNPSFELASKNFFRPIPDTGLPLEHHLVRKEETELILALLKEKPKTSTHILLYGPPGTGKTAYAQGIAREVGVPAYEIITDDKENTTAKRRAAILSCLNMTNSRQGSIIIVDEADNLLNTRYSWFFRGETQDKGWLNQLLEEPGVRMIWITNWIEEIEESVLRRFAYSLSFKPFSQRQRINLWKTILQENQMEKLFDQDDIAELAKRYNVSAGAIDLSVKKALEIGAEKKEEVYRVITLGLDAHQTLLNHGCKVINRNHLEPSYSLEGLNVKGNLSLMMQQLESFNRYLLDHQDNLVCNLSLLFYGPPGTGKSELARYLAHRLDREIIYKRASDLLNCFVGMTEKNIQEAFSEAEYKEAVLVIDEADSLLFPRERARYSWEVSHTNELLAQMERFRGIFICTTNRLPDLDAASIRRFNHKIEFKYLTPEGNLAFYQKLLAPLTDASLDEKAKHALSRMKNLAPGDFRVVRDRFFFYPRDRVTPQALIKALEEEARIKSIYHGEKAIGF